MNTTPTTSAAVLTPAAVAPALLERHKAALRSYVQALAKGEAAKVEEVVEAVWLEAHAAENGEFEEDPTVWLFTKARRRVIGSGPRDSIVREAEAGPGEDEAGNEGEEPRVVVHRTIGSLTPKQQETLRLKFQFNLSLDEMASITGQAKSGTGGLLHHAIVRVGKALGAREDDASPLANDPRVTAYALDEMDADERKYFEKGIASGKALLEREKAIREWGGHITEVLSSGAPVPKRRRKQRGIVWWKSKSLGIGLTLAVLLVLLLVVRNKSSDQAASEDLARTTGSAEVNPGRRTEIAAPDRPPTAELRSGTDRDRTEGSKPQVAAVPRNPRENEVDGERKIVTPAPRGQPEAARSGLVDPQDQTLQAEDAVKEKPGAEPDQVAPLERPVTQARSTSSAGAMTAKKSTSVPSGAGAGEAHLTFDQVKDQPGKGRAAETVDAIPNPGGVRRQLARKQWPKREQVRLEEMLKFSPVPGLRPTSPNPIEAQQEQVASPWNPRKRILRVSLRAKDSPAPPRGPAHLVFAIDVSHSMTGPNRLPLVQEGVRRLVDRLRPDDIISVITYAAKANLALSALPAARSGELRSCLAGLEATGLTNGSAGLTLAYETARDHWIEGGLNVVVLCTDGNFNLGTTNEVALGNLAAAQARKGIRLSVFGFGRTDRNDLRLEMMATSGGGRSCYVNTQEEAERQLVAQIDGLFAPVARDVRLQVEFNPDQVAEYRRIGDGSEQDTTGMVPTLLPGRSVTAMFEITPKPGASGKGALGRLELGYALPETGERQRQAAGLSGRELELAKTGLEFRFALAMAEFGRILCQGRPADTTELDRLDAWVRQNIANDTGGYRTELLQSLELAKAVVESQAAGAGTE